MKYPSKTKLVPLGKKFAGDAGYSFSKSGKVSNGKRGLKRCEWKSAYDLALCLYRGGMIKKAGAGYAFKPEFGLVPYPYIRSLNVQGVNNELA